MFAIGEVEKIHSILIDKFGGRKGVRDFALLESALNRPFATFDAQELYPDPLDKAAAILESIVINHPFVDGNKRTGYVLARLLLMANDWDIAEDQQDKYDFVIAVSKGEMRFAEIKSWLEIHAAKKAS
jgi:death-on-curing protein